jgi:hypothetical protein
VSELAKTGEKRDRDERGFFLPGHAAPGPGRPRTTSEMRELFRDLTPNAIERLRQIIEAGGDDVALKALTTALNRGWGREAISGMSPEDDEGDEGGGKPRVTVSIDLGG